MPIYLIDKMKNETEMGNYVCGIFVEFEKVFDKVDHHILRKTYEFME